MTINQQGRVLSIDMLRGIAVICMVLVHFPLMFWFLKFSPQEASFGLAAALDEFGIGYFKYVFPVFDCFAAPLFVMTSGMAVSLSVHRRRARGVEESKTFRHELIRFVLLVLVGCAYSFHFGSWAYGVSWQYVFMWSVLQNLALAGLVAYFLSKTKVRYQLLTAGLIFTLTPLLQIATDAYTIGSLASPELVELMKSSPVLCYSLMAFVTGPGAPIFPWIGFGVVGCALGSLLARKEFIKSIPYQFLLGIAFIITSQIPAILEALGVTITSGYFLGITQRHPASIFFILGAIGINLLLSSAFFSLENRFDLSTRRLRHPVGYLVTCGQTSLMIFILNDVLSFRVAGPLGACGRFNFVQMLVITLFYFIFQYFLSLGWLDFLRRRNFRYFELCFWIGYCTTAELVLMGVGL